MSEDSLMDISSEMERLDADCIIFYGSETGTAESYATRLAADGRGRFGLGTVVANPADYNFDRLDKVASDKTVVFVLATTGDGEPTENAANLFDSVAGEAPTLLGLGNTPLQSLQFMIFGLGDSTRDHYNAMARSINRALVRLGATRIGEIGEGDDGEGTLEEDFLAWKEKAWAALEHVRVLRRADPEHVYALDVVEQPCLSKDSSTVYAGEFNEQQLKGSTSGPFDSQNPFIAQVSQIRELFQSPERNCLHLDIDLAGSNLSYHTGDHAAIWPMNPDPEVLRLLKALGLADKQDTVIEMQPRWPMPTLPPSPTTYGALFRHYLDICGAPSRDLVAALAPFAPDATSRAETARLGSHKADFAAEVTRPHMNLARLLDAVGRGRTWDKIPLPLLIQGIPRLRPRYYSISSSSREDPRRISVTAVVETRPVSGRFFHGLATNYFLALRQATDGHPKYRVAGPRNSLQGGKVPVHIRQSSFRLPADPLCPVIMVGPGTGVAPFRAFVRERMHLRLRGAQVGPVMLFFGCRRPGEDFLYEDEFEEARRCLGDGFRLITAFSREGPDKVYVQHRIRDMAGEVDGLLRRGGHVYVCGDAGSMAREVGRAMAQVIASQRGVSLPEAEGVVRDMKAATMYQVCHCSVCGFLCVAAVGGVSFDE
ncbi:NADPH-cytochrome P450 reductase [Metarhizium guizhouense ARSEF 977]|uniref:NADPH--hemoprotein reductase n=1 Tax=Metarhizium guizhouense (strain ARSEF 977) TaxID=1276136 RepID=A0A0B4GQS1_METGA|nr:NADPH-cytochrome P450 reductase [Metarhizium guizhouense ARSEF 977]